MVEINFTRFASQNRQILLATSAGALFLLTVANVLNLLSDEDDSTVVFHERLRREVIEPGDPLEESDYKLAGESNQPEQGRFSRKILNESFSYIEADGTKRPKPLKSLNEQYAEAKKMYLAKKNCVQRPPSTTPKPGASSSAAPGAGGGDGGGAAPPPDGGAAPPPDAGAAPPPDAGAAPPPDAPPASRKKRSQVEFTTERVYYCDEFTTTTIAPPPSTSGAAPAGGGGAPPPDAGAGAPPPDAGAGAPPPDAGAGAPPPDAGAAPPARRR